MLPAYLTHVDLHVNGLAHAPGHTAAQERLALQIDAALTKDRAQLEAIRQDALRLVKMNTVQLTSREALTRLNDMVMHATTAYTGTLDPATGATTDGIVWIASSLQGLATITLTTVSEKQG